jgi:hypothetical protein
VYLDYCVIVKLAGNPTRGQEVLEAAVFEKGGMVYLSWAHLVELFGLGIGPTYERIRAYLASFGRSFALIDSDAQAVIVREARWKIGWQNPVIDEDFLCVLGANWDGRSDLNATTLLDVMTRDRSLLPRLSRLETSSASA